MHINTIKVVLFDVGNVIASDYWESIWLTPKFGLADRLSIALDRVKDACNDAWKEFSTKISDENEYWNFCQNHLDLKIEPSLVAETENLTIKFNHNTSDTMKMLRDRDVKIGIISNNTSFWYPKQTNGANCAMLIDNDLIFLSCNEGATKEHGALFRRALVCVDPKTTLVIDDRISNVKSAERLGFRAILFDRGLQNTFDRDGYFVPPPFCSFELRELASDRRRYPEKNI